MTYESDLIAATFRSAARDWLTEGEPIFAALAGTLAAAEHVELSGAVAELRRLLAGMEAPPAPPLPANVRRLVARGSTGPAFAGGGIAVVVGEHGLHVQMRDLLDLDAKYDSTVKP